MLIIVGLNFTFWKRFLCTQSCELHIFQQFFIILFNRLTLVTLTFSIFDDIIEKESSFVIFLLVLSLPKTPWTMFLSYSIPFIHGVKSIALRENMVDSKAVIRLQGRVDYSGFPYLDTRTRRRMYRRESCSKDCLRPWDWINPYPEEGYDLLVIHMRLTGTLIHFDGRTCIFATNSLFSFRVSKYWEIVYYWLYIYVDY